PRAHALLAWAASRVMFLTVSADLSIMCNKPANDVRELKKLLIDLDERRKRVREVVGRDPDDLHLKSILAGILDAETRKHTAKFQGSGVSFEKFRHEVQSFVNITAAFATTSSTPQIHAVEEKENKEAQPQ
ncbi:hypothetical protein N9L68_08305, partial [bacterium]|nr:hypothetical protein [bacterium]